MKKNLKLGGNPGRDELILQERCANPWNGECNNTNIVLYIYFKGSKLPICRACWNKIAEMDVEWGEEFA